MTAASKLAKFIEEKLQSDVRDVMVNDHGGGHYELFGKYYIKLLNNRNYRVLTVNDNAFYEFTSLKNATSWCTLHNQRMFRQADRVYNLDLRICSIQLDIAVQKNIVRNKSSEDRLTTLIKLQEANYKKKLLTQELNSYINNSKSIQANKFRIKNEQNFSYL